MLELQAFPDSRLGDWAWLRPLCHSRVLLTCTEWFHPSDPSGSQAQWSDPSHLQSSPSAPLPSTSRTSVQSVTTGCSFNVSTDHFFTHWVMATLMLTVMAVCYHISRPLLGFTPLHHCAPHLQRRFCLSLICTNARSPTHTSLRTHTRISCLVNLCPPPPTPRPRNTGRPLLRWGGGHFKGAQSSTVEVLVTSSTQAFFFFLLIDDWSVRNIGSERGYSGSTLWARKQP